MEKYTGVPKSDPDEIGHKDLEVSHSFLNAPFSYRIFHLFELSVSEGCHIQQFCKYVLGLSTLDCVGESNKLKI